MLIAAKDKVVVMNVSVQLREEFNIKDFEVVKNILGMAIVRDRNAGK